MWNRFKRIGLMCCCVVGLAACAHPTTQRLGSTQDEVLQLQGEPDIRVQTQEGSRWVYSFQPFGQKVYWMLFDQEGRFVETKEVLDRPWMDQIQIGKDTKDTVFAMFGRPADKQHFALKDHDAWMYRFKDQGVFDMAFWVQFDVEGIVREKHITLDPWADRGDLFFLN